MDIETLRKKQQALMVQLVERKVRSRAEQLYYERGQRDGQALEDWVKAESEVLEKSILAPMYRRLRTTGSESENLVTNANPQAVEASVSESTA